MVEISCEVSRAAYGFSTSTNIWKTVTYSLQVPPYMVVALARQQGTCLLSRGYWCGWILSLSGVEQFWLTKWLNLTFI